MAGQMRCVRFIGDVRMYVFPQSLVHPFFLLTCKMFAGKTRKLVAKSMEKMETNTVWMDFYWLMRT